MPSKLVIESSYEVVADVGYIRLGTPDRSRSGTQEVLDAGPAGSAIILDLDRRARVVGIEMLHQSTLLAQPTRAQCGTCRRRSCSRAARYRPLA